MNIGQTEQGGKTEEKYLYTSRFFQSLMCIISSGMDFSDTIRQETCIVSGILVDPQAKPELDSVCSYFWPKLYTHPYLLFNDLFCSPTLWSVTKPNVSKQDLFRHKKEEKLFEIIMQSTR